MMMDIRPIQNEADLTWALAEVERYFDAEPDLGTPEAARFDVLTALIKAYEDEHWHIDAAHPVDALVAFMEAKGHTQSDLATVLGSKSRASEILNRKRELSKDHIWTLHSAWGIAPDLLIKPYAVDQAA